MQLVTGVATTLFVLLFLIMTD